MRRAAGFTLIELSIVLVIIGLLIAGVLVGRSLIESARIQRMISDYTGFQTAFFTFKQKYGQPPGDFTDAYTLWPGQCGASAGVCNGTGNGIIDLGAPGPETYQAFKHLSLAGLIPGAYTGVEYNGSRRSVGDVNVPRGQIEGSIYTLGHDNSLSPFNTEPRTYFYIGCDVVANTPDGDPATINCHNPAPNGYGNILSGLVASTIDTKVDDGAPQKGKARIYGYDAGCGGNSYVLTPLTLCYMAIRVD